MILKSSLTLNRELLTAVMWRAGMLPVEGVSRPKAILSENWIL
jgi:hypothetical protein